MKLLDELNLGWSTRLPMVLQTEAAECGLACLAMVAGYYGDRSGLVGLRQRFGLSLKGATLRDLVRIADQLGLASRPVRLELEELSLLRMPCILHWDLNHFVVLKSAGLKGVVVYDPSFGRRRLSLNDVSSHFSGVALELTPVGDYQPAQTAPRVKIRALLGHLVGLKSTLAHLFLLALAMQIFGIVSPLFMQWVVDHALSTADRDLLLTLTLGFLMLLLIRTSIAAMRGWMLMVLGASLKVQGRSNLFSHLIRLPAAYFETRHLADVMSRFDSQETILQAITTDIVEAMLDGLMVGILLIVMFVFAPMLTVVVLAGASLYGLLRGAFYMPLRQASAESIVWGARRDSHFLETLRGMKTIKLFNGQDGRRAYWMNLLVETVNRQLIGQKLRLFLRTANSLLIGALGIVIVWLGAKQVMEHTLSIGMLLSFISYKDQFLDRVSKLIDTAMELRMLSLHAERLADIALTPPEPRDRLVDSQHPRLAVSLEVRNLCFRYSDNDPWILENMSFRIEPGESVAVVGPSGCGKTTLLKILASLLQATEGEILVNDQPLARLGVERYRSMIGVVMQDDQLFAGSIADNISFFSELPDVPSIEQCARLAAVHDDIIGMPMGYNTLIGDMGTVLSGGQKQRVLIARALYFQPSILLLDEATSHLDIQRESAVNNAVRTMQVTRILVAHRPETIQSAERVITLEAGSVQRDEKRPVHGTDAIPPTGVSVASLYRADSPYWLATDTDSHRNGNHG